MWSLTRISPQSQSDLTADITELLQSTAFKLISVTGGGFLCYYLVAAAIWPLESRIADSVALTVLAFSILAAWLNFKKQLLMAQIVWLAGLIVAVTLAIYNFQHPEIAFLYSLLPLMAVVTMGWWAGLLAEGIVIALLMWLADSSAMPVFPTSYNVLVIMLGVFTGLLGWAITHTLLTVTRESLLSSQRAYARTSEAYQQKLELAQVCEDLTLVNQELARLSDRLKAMHHIAEEARRAKEEFVANVSHELRTPLNMIISFSEMITQSPKIYGKRLPLALLADITAIQRNSRHLSRLVDDVLDLSQFEAGRMTLSKEEVSIERILDASTETVRVLFDSKKLYLKVEMAPGIPDFLCDRRRIQQVVVNLLSNAGRYTEQGGVHIKARTKNNDIIISVADTGPGISVEDQEIIFEPFRQLDSSSSRRHGGSGLGLNISKRFVEMHKGKMWLESEVGKGTTFYFSLPFDTPLSGSSKVSFTRWISSYEQRIRPVKAPAPKVVPRFVLLEPGDTLQRLFKRYSDEVEINAVKNVADVIIEANRLPAQAVVVNMFSFGQDVDLMDQLSNLPYGTPTVMCWVPGEEEAAKQLGVAYYLTKPIDRESLLTTLESLGGNIKTVLVTDENLEVLQLFARLLSSSKQGYQVLQAGNGRLALDILRERQPDVMLLDLMMPGMDGYQVLQEKREDPSIRDIPVITISARDPIEGAMVNDRLVVTRSGGLSILDTLNCIQRISEILTPSA